MCDVIDTISINATEDCKAVERDIYSACVVLHCVRECGSDSNVNSRKTEKT